MAKANGKSIRRVSSRKRLRGNAASLINYRKQKQLLQTSAAVESISPQMRDNAPPTFSEHDDNSFCEEHVSNVDQTSSEQELESTFDWILNLIRTVRARPALYNTKMKEHFNRNTMLTLWTEVCETMVPSWHDMTKHEQALKSKEVQQRWRNLRTCFRRELSKQRSDKSGQSSGKRRKYIYFDQLLFLLPTLEDKERESGDSSTLNHEESDNDKIEATYDDLWDNVVKEEMNDSSASQNTCYEAQNTYQEALSSYQQPHSVWEEKEEEEIDEDKLFLMSLVPSFRKMSDDDKLEAKMQILATIRQILQKKS